MGTLPTPTPQGPPATPVIHMAKFLTNLPDPWFIRPGEIWQLSVYSRFSVRLRSAIEIYNAAGALSATDYSSGVVVNRNRVVFVIDPRYLSIPIASIGKIIVYIELETLPNNYAICTEERTFLINQACTQENSVTVKWINNLGAQDLYTFYLRQRRSMTVEKVLAKKELSFPFVSTDAGLQVVSNDASDTGLMHTGYEPLATRQWMKDLFTSKDVWIEENGVKMPIIVKNDTIDWLDTEELLQLDVSYQYASNISTLNG